MFLLKILFKLLPLRKCFLMSFKNILLTFLLTLRQYGGLNHMILHLRVFFFFVLVLVVFGINVMLSWKPLFLGASEYIGIDLWKTIWLEEMSEIRLGIALGISLIIVGSDLIFCWYIPSFYLVFCMVNMCLCLNSVRRQGS